MAHIEHKNLKYIKRKMWQIKSKEKTVKNKNKHSRHIRSLGQVKTGTYLAEEGQYHIILETKTIMDIHTYKLKTSQKVYIIKNECKIF